ncbi:MAG: HU family DNA-binding protein [Phocaeicola sp.]|uniref:HU family DNA-binding protein n=1 Tax=Phocaeicola TaxID=909656 RepID=UPI00234F06DD|nr:HU family DNA-binding protein [Phocaeicola oris]MCE2615596.1 HU family DNA-binding protein [Phocaeicola oris]
MPKNNEKVSFKNPFLHGKNVVYKVIPRVNPQKPKEAPKYYPKAIGTGYMTMADIVKRIEKECTITRADATAVIVALEDIIADAMSAGQIVQLGDFGNFYLSIKGKGALTEQDFVPTLVSKAKVNFRPGKTVREALRNLSFSKYVKNQEGQTENKDTPEEETPGE